MKYSEYVSVNPYPAKLIYLNFHLPEVVSRYRDPQLQIAGNDSYLHVPGLMLAQGYFNPYSLEIIYTNHGDQRVIFNLKS